MPKAYRYQKPHAKHIQNIKIIKKPKNRLMRHAIGWNIGLSTLLVLLVLLENLSRFGQIPNFIRNGPRFRSLYFAFARTSSWVSFCGPYCCHLFFPLANNLGLVGILRELDSPDLQRQQLSLSLFSRFLR